MAKQLFIAGGITAEDWSTAQAILQLAEADEEFRAILAAKLPDIAIPVGIPKRMEAATLVTATNEQRLIAEKDAENADLKVQLADATKRP